MSVSAEMYIVISLMFAVFAAVAAIGTSVVLGAGFERLRAGFEIVKKQTGFFADAIHKLDERTKMLDEQSKVMKESVAGLSVQVERVEKQTGFFSDAIHSIETRILQGGATQAPPVVEKSVEEQSAESAPKKEKSNKMVLPQIVNWAGTTETGRLLEEAQSLRAEPRMMEEETPSGGISSVFLDYLRSENRGDHGKEIVYH